MDWSLDQHNESAVMPTGGAWRKDEAAQKEAEIEIKSLDVLMLQQRQPQQQHQSDVRSL